MYAPPGHANTRLVEGQIKYAIAVVTGQTDPKLGEYSFDFAALSRMDTIVLLMAKKNLAQITAGLIEAGLDPQTPAASIENATCFNQRVVAGCVDDIAAMVQASGLSSPMVTVIGETARLPNNNAGLTEGLQAVVVAATESPS